MANFDVCGNFELFFYFDFKFKILDNVGMLRRNCHSKAGGFSVRIVILLFSSHAYNVQKWRPFRFDFLEKKIDVTPFAFLHDFSDSGLYIMQ